MKAASILGKCVNATILILGLCCVVELTVFFVAREKSSIYRREDAFPGPSGYRVDKTYFRLGANTCYLLRVTADGCPYCKADRRQLDDLTRLTIARGCSVIAVAPEAGAMAARPDASIVQLEYIDFGLGSKLNPFATPQTLLLGADGRLVWQKQGPVGDEDMKYARTAIDHIGLNR